jgi:glycine cleavage system H protein
LKVDSHYPQHLYYTTGHQWLRFEEAYAFTGITDFAQKALAGVLIVTIPYLNKIVVQGSYLGTIETEQAEMDLFMPVTGTIAAINPEIFSAPGSVNNDCYHTWLVQIEAAQTDQKNLLLNAEAYEAYSRQENKNRTYA